MENRLHPLPTDDITIVVPMFNEETVIRAFHERLLAVLDGCDFPFQVLYIDDGSRDTSAEIISSICAADSRIGLLKLSRNFGKEIAITAGLDHTKSAATVIIDADLQDPPEVIPDLLMEWKKGFDVVYAKRTIRHGDTILKKVTAAGFYKLAAKLGNAAIPQNTGDFRLLSRRAVEAVCSLRERHRFMKGIFSWVGFRQKEVLYQRDPRFAGETKWSYWKLWNFALEGFTSFTLAPLKLSTYLGLITAAGALAYSAYIIWKTLVTGVDVPGYASLMVVTLLLGGIQLVVLGIIGEYLGRTFNETKDRPLYFVESYVVPTDNWKIEHVSKKHQQNIRPGSL